MRSTLQLSVGSTRLSIVCVIPSPTVLGAAAHFSSITVVNTCGDTQRKTTINYNKKKIIIKYKGTYRKVYICKCIIVIVTKLNIDSTDVQGMSSNRPKNIQRTYYILKMSYKNLCCLRINITIIRILAYCNIT